MVKVRNDLSFAFHYKPASSKSSSAPSRYSEALNELRNPLSIAPSPLIYSNEIHDKPFVTFTSRRNFHPMALSLYLAYKLVVNDPVCDCNKAKQGILCITNDFLWPTFSINLCGNREHLGPKSWNILLHLSRLYSL